MPHEIIKNINNNTEERSLSHDKQYYSYKPGDGVLYKKYQDFSRQHSFPEGLFSDPMITLSNRLGSTKIVDVVYPFEYFIYNGTIASRNFII